MRHECQKDDEEKDIHISTKIKIKNKMGVTRENIGAFNKFYLTKILKYLNYSLFIIKAFYSKHKINL